MRGSTACSSSRAEAAPQPFAAARISSTRRWEARASSPVTTGSRPCAIASRKSAITARWASCGKSMMLAPLPVEPSASTISSRPSAQAPADQRGIALRAGDLDPLRVAGIGRRGGDQCRRRAAAGFEQGGDVVLRLHAVQRGGAGLGRDHFGDADERAEEIERVDRLRQQHAAAVAPERAPARFVVIGLRTPPRHGQEGRLDAAEFAPVQRRLQPQARGAEAVLQGDAEGLAGPARDIDQLPPARAGQFQRLLHEDMLAGFEAARRNLEMARGRRQHDAGRDVRIGQRGVEIGRGRERELPGIGRGTVRRAADGPAHLRTIRQIEQAPGMRQGGRAEADDGDAELA